MNTKLLLKYTIILLIIFIILYFSLFYINKETFYEEQIQEESFNTEKINYNIKNDMTNSYKTLLECKDSNKLAILKTNGLTPLYLEQNKLNLDKNSQLDLDKFPADIYYAELEPGDSICIPPWWWHAVESNDYTIGVAKLWEREDQYDLYKDNPKYLSLHRRNWFSAFLGKYIFDWVRKIF